MDEFLSFTVDKVEIYLVKAKHGFYIKYGKVSNCYYKRSGIRIL